MSASARVTVTLEINIADCWGDDCTVKQIRESASEEVRRQLSVKISNLDYKIVGKIHVDTIIQGDNNGR